MLGLLYRISDAVRQRCRRDDHGRLGEELAHSYLRRRGCKIVARNYRTRSGSGEVDLIAWHKGTLIFVEVKARNNSAYGRPEEFVDSEKRARILLAARDYARRANVAFERARFDIVSVVLEPCIQLEWLPDAYAARKVTI